MTESWRPSLKTFSGRNSSRILDRQSNRRSLTRSSRSAQHDSAGSTISSRRFPNRLTGTHCLAAERLRSRLRRPAGSRRSLHRRNSNARDASNYRTEPGRIRYSESFSFCFIRTSRRFRCGLRSTGHRFGTSASTDYPLQFYRCPKSPVFYCRCCRARTLSRPWTSPQSGFLRR